MMGLPREQLLELQRGGLERRFGQLRDEVPLLRRLADIQGVSRLDELDDVLTLLFDHSTFKSYPASFLEKHRYAQLTAWLDKLTTVDLSGVDVSGCRSIDDWMIKLRDETPLAVVHTSGTSGTMSFLPRTKAEFRKFMEQFPTLFFQTFGSDGPVLHPPLNIDCVYPFYRSGGLSHTVLNDAVVEVVAGGEDRFHAAYPERLSADLMLLAAKQRAAAAQGQLDRLEVSPDLAARHREFEAQRRSQPEHMTRFFEQMRSTLAGRQIFMVGSTSLLFSLAAAGLKQGLKQIFAPSSVLVSGGGAKGIVLPDDWQSTVKAFFGVNRVHLIYGMTEMAGQYSCCEHGHYHSVPWVIPYVLDLETSQALPRRGRVTGRFAFFDLLPDTRWGGFISGDEVTMEWDAACPCGQTTPYIVDGIRRVNETKGGAGGLCRSIGFSQRSRGLGFARNEGRRRDAVRSRNGHSRRVDPLGPRGVRRARHGNHLPFARPEEISLAPAARESRKAPRSLRA
jgi:hypothetical protein